MQSLVVDRSFRHALRRMDGHNGVEQSFVPPGSSRYQFETNLRRGRQLEGIAKAKGRRRTRAGCLR
jgi:hypothetical protein